MKKYKKVLIRLSIVVAIGLVMGLFFGGNYLYNLALNPDTPKDFIFDADHNVSAEDVNEDETSGTVSQDDTTWLLEQSNYEDFYITSKDGLKLHNYLLRNDSTEKWIIAVHGYTSEGKLMAPYARKFFDMGYNVILPDLRGHGQSEGDYIGMGWDERFDIIDLIQYIIEDNKNSKIVLFGVSMGASTVMNVSGRLGDASALSQIKKSKTPMLFIHGDADTFVPSHMVDELYSAATVEKEKLIIPDAGHAKSKDVDPKLYWSTIITFINRYV